MKNRDGTEVSEVEVKHDLIPFDERSQQKLLQYLHTLAVYSYADNEYRYYPFLSGKKTGLSDKAALEFVSDWIGSGITYCERILSAPGLDFPYLSYNFRMISIDEHTLHVYSSIFSDTVEGPYDCGEMYLWIHRLKHDRYQIHYSNDEEWETFAEELIRIAHTPSEEDIIAENYF